MGRVGRAGSGRAARAGEGCRRGSQGWVGPILRGSGVPWHAPHQCPTALLRAPPVASRKASWGRDASQRRPSLRHPPGPHQLPRRRVFLRASGRQNRPGAEAGAGRSLGAWPGAWPELGRGGAREGQGRSLGARPGVGLDVGRGGAGGLGLSKQQHHLVAEPRQVPGELGRSLGGWFTSGAGPDLNGTVVESA